MRLGPGHLAEHPLPPGITGALGLGGYQLLVDLAGVGAGRLGRQAFLLVAPDAPEGQPDPGTQLVLHHERISGEPEAALFGALAAQLAYLRLAGYRLVAERAGLRSRLHVVDPSTGAIALTIPERHPGGFLRRGRDAAGLLATARTLGPAGRPPDGGDPEWLRQALLALALRDPELSGAQAAELADRALALVSSQGLELPAALDAARSQITQG